MLFVWKGGEDVWEWEREVERERTREKSREVEAHRHRQTQAQAQTQTHTKRPSQIHTDGTHLLSRARSCRWYEVTSSFTS